MRLLRTLSFAALMSGLALAQSNASNTTSDPSNLAGEVNQLRELMAQQQKQLADQQKQLADQQKELEKLRKHVSPQPDAMASKSTDSSSASSSSDDSIAGPKLVNTSLTAPASATRAAARPVSDPTTQETERKESPLSFRIGGAEFTPGGFMDFTAIIRSTNTGNLGTNFFAIPFSTAQQGHLTETRLTAGNSRLTLKANEKFGKNDVTAYVETDFLGNDAANVNVTTNSHTLRLRQYFLSVKRDKFEIYAGQMYGWLTPNRNGLDPFPQHVSYTLDMDPNFQVGLTWVRQAAVRFIYHANDKLQFGVSIENPEQFGGQGEITFPNQFNSQLANGTQLASQIDSATNSSTPNLHPDIIPKIAYDTTMGGKHFHVEAAGLLSGFKITDLPTVTGATFVSHTVEGGGAEAAVDLELFKNFHLVSNGFWSDGGGRYIFGTAPDLVVLPTNAAGQTCVITGTTTKADVGCDARISLVHSYAGIIGLENQITPRTMLYGYYGAMYAQRNFGVDLTSTAASQPFVGFGGPSSANTNNRDIQEATLGWIQTFWRNPQYGALQLITQASYLTRSPWFVAAGAPKNAHLVMPWVDLRFVFP